MQADRGVEQTAEREVFRLDEQVVGELSRREQFERACEAALVVHERAGDHEFVQKDAVRVELGPGHSRADEHERAAPLELRERRLLGPTVPRTFERHVERFLPEELDLYFDDVVDAAERIWDILDNYKEVVEALEDTNESVISHRQNDVLRFLTVFSVVLLPLSVITGIFGMNVTFPGFGTVWAFWTIFVVMIAVLAGLLAFFRHKRWL